jgi:hypothetical protein
LAATRYIFPPASSATSFKASWAFYLACHNSRRVWEIGHIINDDWFCPERDFAPVTERDEDARRLEELDEQLEGGEE